VDWHRVLDIVLSLVDVFRRTAGTDQVARAAATAGGDPEAATRLHQALGHQLEAAGLIARHCADHCGW
jgi:hypothetical protein